MPTCRKLLREPVSCNSYDTSEESKVSTAKEHSSHSDNLELNQQHVTDDSRGTCGTTISTKIKWRSLSGLNLFHPTPCSAYQNIVDQDDCCCNDNHQSATRCLHSFAKRPPSFDQRQVHFDGLAIGATPISCTCKDRCRMRGRRRRRRPQHQNGPAADTAVASRGENKLGEPNEGTRETCGSCLHASRHFKRGQNGTSGIGGGQLRKICTINRPQSKDYIKRQKLLHDLLLGCDSFADTCYSSRPQSNPSVGPPSSELLTMPTADDEFTNSKQRIKLASISNYLVRPSKKSKSRPLAQAPASKQEDDEDGDAKKQIEKLANGNNECEEQLDACGKPKAHVIEILNADTNNSDHACDHFETSEQLANNELIVAEKEGGAHFLVGDGRNSRYATNKLTSASEQPASIAVGRVKGDTQKEPTTKIPISMATFNADNTANAFILTMHNKSKLESRRKAAKMLTAIVVLFGICYMPVHLINFLRLVMTASPEST